MQAMLCVFQRPGPITYPVNARRGAYSAQGICGGRWRRATRAGTALFSNPDAQADGNDERREGDRRTAG